MQAWSPQLLRSHYSALVIQEPPAMVAMRDEPYPQEPPDLSIFEEPTEEYGIASTIDPDTVPMTFSEVLIQLVKDRKFDDADHLLTELMESGVDIKQDFAYAHAAINAYLYRKDVSQTQRLSLFRSWWSLIPEASSRVQYNFEPILLMLLSRTHVPDLPVIMEFALISASKGYADRVAKHVIPVVARYSPPEVSAVFLGKFRDVSRTYLKKLGRQSRVHARYRASQWHNLALQSHHSAGHLQKGLESLQAVFTPSWGEVFVASLKRSRVSRDLEPPPHLGLMSNEANASTVHPALIPAARSSMIQPSNTIPLGDLKDFDNFYHRLKSEVRAYARVGTTFEKRTLPSAPTLAQFMQQCIELGRMLALLRLRVLLCRPGYARHQRHGLWVLAEMLYHYYRHEYRGVLRTYIRHYHAVGLPLKAGYLRRFGPGELCDVKFFGSYAPLLRSQNFSPVGLFPTCFQTALVWRVIVETAESVSELDDLYKELLGYIKTAKGIPTKAQYHKSSFLAFLRQPRDPFPDESSYLQPLPVPSQFDAAHFAPFIKAFASRGATNRYIDILTDMQDLDIPVSTQCLTIVCSTFAINGEMEKLHSLLDEMEDSLRRDKHSEPSAIPPPTSETYTTVILFLLRKKNVDAAMTIARRLLENAQYVPGTNSETDQVLRALTEAVTHEYEGLIGRPDTPSIDGQESSIV
ncbi:unnamed protein product [Somion occarium]